MTLQLWSLLPENTHASIAALGSHGCHYFPAVDDRVIALDAAQQGIPVVSESGRSKRKKEDFYSSSYKAYPTAAPGAVSLTQTLSPSENEDQITLPRTHNDAGVVSKSSPCNCIKSPPKHCGPYIASWGGHTGDSCPGIGANVVCFNRGKVGCTIKSPHHINMVIQKGYSCTWGEKRHTK